MSVTANDSDTFRVCGEVLVHRHDDVWMVSNPRTHAHLEMDSAALNAFTEHASGAAAPVWGRALAAGCGWERTGYTGDDGLWAAPAGIAGRVGAQLAGEALFAALRRHLFLLREGADEYGDYLSPLESPLDTRHLGSFHQRVGQTLLRRRVRDHWPWWQNQKFSEDGTAVLDGPYKNVQAAFFDSYFAAAGIAGERILDFACGNGYFTEKFAQLGAAATGLDTAQPLIDMARQNFGETAQFVHTADPAGVLDWLKAQLPGSFDRVYMSDILLLLMSPETGDADPHSLSALLDALAALLPAGGRLHMMEPNGIFWLAGQYGDEAGRSFAVVPEYRRPLFNVAPTLDETVGLLAKSGFVLAEYRHPQAEDAADTPAGRNTDEFPTWDFLTFRRWPEESAGHGHA